MTNSDRGHDEIEIGGDTYDFYFDLYDYKELEDKHDLASIDEVAEFLNSLSFTEVLELIELGLKDSDLSQEEIGRGIKHPGNAIGIITQKLMNSLDVNLEDRDIPENMKKEIEKQKEKMKNRPTKKKKNEAGS